MGIENGITEGELEAFVVSCRSAFRETFALARQREHFQYALALNPEFRGWEDEGWSTNWDAYAALKDYTALLETLPMKAIKVRVSLSLYLHMSESAGLYESIKNMMRLASGEDYSFLPFQHLVPARKAAGQRIAPNAGAIMRDVLAHADELALVELRDVIERAFDFDLRNAVAHADYIVWADGVRLRRRAGGRPRVVGYPELTARLSMAVAFFETLQNYIEETKATYNPPFVCLGRFNSGEPLFPALISHDGKRGFSCAVTMSLDDPPGSTRTPPELPAP